MDSNINLINLESNNTAINFIESSMQHGFIQTINKATRICNDKVSLIDHIFTNTKSTELVTGVIINDISDHFITFIQPSHATSRPTTKNIFKQDMSRQRMRGPS